MKSVAEAPCKAIITGEHFVVHGSWALAAALPRRVRAEVSDSDSYLVRSAGFEGPEKEHLSPISAVVESMAREYSVSPKIKVDIRSDVPRGAGLGSSASVLVAVAAAFSRLRSVSAGSQELIDHSMVGERLIHGRPSGIDPAICALGGVILFRPGSRPKQVKPRGGASLVVSYSGKTRSTKSQISRVGSTKETSPHYFETLTAAVSDLTLSAADDLAKGDWKDLGRLLTLDHAALSSLGISDPTLDSMVDLMVSLGSSGAKLTGAGGGGSVLGVAPRGKEKRIVSGLQARGFETFGAHIPVGGVRSWLER